LIGQAKFIDDLVDITASLAEAEKEKKKR